MYKSAEGCLVAGCECKRWYEVKPAAHEASTLRPDEREDLQARLQEQYLLAWSQVE
jgi:hypothetical protein